MPDAEWLTTTLLLDRLREGDELAWSPFVERFRGALLRFARASGGLAEEDAEDVAQETLRAFVDGLRSGSYERGRGRLRSWLFGIAANKVKSRREGLAIEGRHTRPESAAGEPGAWPDQRSLEESFSESFGAALLEFCLAKARTEFDPKTWRAFEAVNFDGRTPAEAALALGMTRNAVFIAKHRVLKRLRELTAEFED